MVEANLGDLLTVTIDPNWPHRSLWQHPFGEVLRVPFVDWEGGVEESVAPNYTSTAVIGRSEDYLAWVGNPNRTVTITFHFRAQGINGTTPQQVIEEEVVLPARFLDALKYPVFNEQQEQSYAPPPVILRIGALLTARCVLTGGDIQWKLDTLDPDTLLPHAAEFAAQFQVVRAFKPNLSYFPSGSRGGPISGDWQ